MTEKLVTYKTAVLLKEKGFNVPCYEFYLIDTQALYEDGDIFEKTNHNEFPDIVSAPKQSLVQKWMREIHGFIVLIQYDRFAKYSSFILDSKLEWHEYNSEFTSGIDYGTAYCETYEECLEQSILHSITLIK
jgi:hypothetical protein